MAIMRKYKTPLAVLSVLFLLGALGIVLFFILGKAFITEYHSDFTDTLLWANASMESGRLFKPSFDYAYRLAFGGQWLFMPFIRLFGVGMKALRGGMCLFALLFTAALILFFRSLHGSLSLSFFEAGVMLLAVCSTKKVREIFFGHIIHYSLAVFYLLLAFILLSCIFSGKTAAKRTAAAVLFTIVLFMCSANGTVQMLYVTLPLLAGCLLEGYLAKDKRMLGICGCICAAAAAGFLFSKSLNTNYSDSYSVIVPASDWAENLRNFPLRWISLFYQLPDRNLYAFTSLWLKTVFRIIAALLMLVGMLLSFIRSGLVERREERIFIFTSWAMFTGLLFFFVFGKISDVDWRLTPLFFAAQIVVLILFRRVLAGRSGRTVSGAMTLVCGLVLLAQVLSNGFTVLRIPYDRKLWYAEDGLLETLKAHDLNYGYITSYWHSNCITVLTDDTIRVRPVAWDEGRPYLNPFNCDVAWYDDQPGQERYFLAVKDTEYDPDSGLAKEALETYTCFHEDTRNSRPENYVIMVLDRNVMKEEYDRVIDRYR